MRRRFWNQVAKFAAKRAGWHLRGDPFMTFDYTTGTVTVNPRHTSGTNVAYRP